MFAPWVNPKESRLIRWRTSQGNLGKYQPMICRLQTPKCTTQSVTNSFETDSNWNGQHSNCTWWLRVLEPPTCVSGCTKMVYAATVISHGEYAYRLCSFFVYNKSVFWLVTIWERWGANSGTNQKGQPSEKDRNPPVLMTLPPEKVVCKIGKLPQTFSEFKVCGSL